MNVQTTTPMQRGFTMIETMVVVAIMATLMTLAAPSLTPIVEGWRVRQAAEGLLSTMYFARSEAVKRNGNVIIRKEPSTDTSACTAGTGNTDWGSGWFVFVDADSNGVLDGGEEVLQRFASPTNVSVTRTGGGNCIEINRWGLVNGVLPSFGMKPYGKAETETSVRGICMSSGGRIRITAAGVYSC